MVSSVESDADCPVFIDGQRVGDATNFSIERDVSTSQVNGSPVVTSYEYLFWIESTVCDFDTDTVQFDGAPDTISVEIATDNGPTWNVHSLYDVLLTDIEIEDTYVRVDGVACKLETTTMDSLGPDVERVETHAQAFDIETIERAHKQQKSISDVADAFSSTQELTLDEDTDISFKIHDTDQ